MFNDINKGFYRNFSKAFRFVRFLYNKILSDKIDYYEKISKILLVV
ncbi:helix-turn-helix domain-containing protein [Borreliella mayonii]